MDASHIPKHYLQFKRATEGLLREDHPYDELSRFETALRTLKTETLLGAWLMVYSQMVAPSCRPKRVAHYSFAPVDDRLVQKSVIDKLYCVITRRLSEPGFPFNADQMNWFMHSYSAMATLLQTPHTFPEDEATYEA